MNGVEFHAVIKSFMLNMFSSVMIVSVISVPGVQSMWLCQCLFDDLALYVEPFTVQLGTDVECQTIKLVRMIDIWSTGMKISSFWWDCHHRLHQILSIWQFLMEPVRKISLSSFWWDFHHWLHQKLSIWQLLVEPVMKISNWQILVEPVMKISSKWWCSEQRWKFQWVQVLYIKWLCLHIAMRFWDISRQSADFNVINISFILLWPSVFIKHTPFVKKVIVILGDNFHFKVITLRGNHSVGIGHFSNQGLYSL